MPWDIRNGNAGDNKSGVLSHSAQTVEKPFFAVNLTLSVRAYALPARCDYVGIAHMGEPLVKLFHITTLFYRKTDFLSMPLPVGQHGKAMFRCRTQ